MENVKSRTNELGTVYYVFEENMANFEKKIKKLQNKAKQLENGKIEYKTIGETFEKIGKVTYKMIQVEITHAEIPIINGWEFIGTIDHSMGNGNLIKTVPTWLENIPYEFRHKKAICEHCNISRYRKDTYILYNKDNNEYKQVGKTCLKDFLGHANPHNYAKYAQMLIELEETEWDNCSAGYGSPRYIEVKEFLSISSAIINKVGYVSKANSMEFEQKRTSYEVYDQIFSPKSRTVDLTEKELEEGKEIAKKVIDFITNIETKNDYEENLKILLSNKYVSVTNIGYLASSIVFYNRALDLIKEKEKIEQKGVNSEFYGNIKDRPILKLTVEKQITWQGDYGIVKFNIMTDDKDNIFTWKTGNCKLEEGKTYQIKGTIQEHILYDNKKQTVLSRCKVI